MTGRVLQVNVKPEVPGERGLPKRAVPMARFTPDGVVGDYNRYRHEKKGDDPGDAVLVMTTDVLAALRAEGWPVAPGDLGENVTVDGVLYASISPGQRYRLGGAEIEIVHRCDPCTNLHILPYVGEARVAEFMKATMGRRGWYARVLKEGEVKPGDLVEVA